MNIWGRNITEAEVLQASAVAVAAPRYMGAFASAIGVNIIEKWPGFVSVEIFSGLAMALLEGWAIAFTFRRWRSLTPGTLQWYILLIPQVFLLLALPSTVTPYLVSAQLRLPVAMIFPVYLLWAWSFLVAAVAPLIVAAVGYSDVEGKPKPITREQQFTYRDDGELTIHLGVNEPLPESKPESKPDNGNESKFKDHIYGYLSGFAPNELPGPTRIAKEVGTSKPTANKWLQAYKAENRLNGYHK